MSLPSILIFLHVMAAITWVGGAILIHVYLSRTLRAKDQGELVRRLEDIKAVGNSFFAPVSLSVMILGFAVLGVERIGVFSQFWIVTGLIGFAFSFLVGFFYLGPEAGKLAEAFGSGAGTQARLRRYVITSRLELLILTIVVFFMVVKPF
jgi:uncharacterized membrane protein